MGETAHRRTHCFDEHNPPVWPGSAGRIQPTCMTWERRKNTTHPYDLGLQEEYNPPVRPGSAGRIQPTCTTWRCRKNTTYLYDLGAQEEYNPPVRPGSAGRIQPTCRTWERRKNTTHLHNLGAQEEYISVTKTTHLYDLGAQEGGVNKCRQMKHLYAIPHRGRQLAHLAGSAQDAGSIAQVVGVAAPHVHTVTGGHCHLQVKHSKPELWTGNTQWTRTLNR